MQMTVINLASQESRWVEASRQFNALGLQPVRQLALPGSALNDTEAAGLTGLYSERLNRLQYHKPLAPGEIGCYASHMAAWQQLLASGDAAMAIFEDDVEIDADLARPEGPWVVVDGYHGFRAVPTDLGPVADRIFYVAGGYKYAMAGEGAAFLHAPPGFGPRPRISGWYAEFGDLEGPPGGVGFARDATRFFGATFDVSGVYRFAAAAEMLAAEGLTTDAMPGATCHGCLLPFQSTAWIRNSYVVPGWPR